MATETATDGSPKPQGSNGVYASYVPHDLKYSTEFEDSLITAVLHNENNNSEEDPATATAAQGPGLRIIPDDSDELAVKDVSIRAQDISFESLPNISEDELPLPLDDPRRIFASSVPGIKLTHPGGYLEGGPALDPDMDTFPDDFLANHPGIRSEKELRKALDKEVENSVEQLKERLRARQKAQERNEQLERELKTLTDNHDMELKMHRRMAEENQKKREAKEKRRQARAGG